jgi:peptide chain release factor 3
VFRPLFSSDQILGVVGELQFDVINFRIQHEYGVTVAFARLPFNAARWFFCDDEKALKDFMEAQGHVICHDQHGQTAILLDNLWRLKFLGERYPKVRFNNTSEKI